ncbi:MAG: hypothetical protein ABIN89_05805 [Chitinophagaceae bacterium]
MRIFLPVIVLLIFSSPCFSQVSDFIKVKKRNNRTLKTFFPGSLISCQTVYGNYIGGIVTAIHSDSVFVKEFDIRSVPNQWGVSSVDTLGSYIVGFHYKDIQTVEFQKRESFGFVKNGSMLMIGGIGYAALNLVNGKYLKQPITDRENLKSLGISLGVAGIGFLLNQLNKMNNRNGKKYIVEYVRMTGPPALRAF